MKVTKICCQGCGADLQIDETIRFVTCNYCNARLEIVHDATVTHTRQLDQIARTTHQLANNLQVIELQNDLERLDREWSQDRDGFLTRDKAGNLSEPSAIGSIIMGTLVIVFGLVFIGTAMASGAPAFFLVFGLGFIGLAVFGIMRGTTQAGNYRIRMEDYESRRHALLSRIKRERESRG